MSADYKNDKQSKYLFTEVNWIFFYDEIYMIWLISLYRMVRKIKSDKMSKSWYVIHTFVYW